MPVPAVIATWLAGTAASDAYTRAVNSARQPSEGKRLREQVRLETRRRFPGRRFDKWYKSDETWKRLVAHTSTAHDDLRSSLREALWGTPRLLSRRPPTPEQLELTNELIDATISHFIQCLDAANAVAVADFRSEQRDAGLADLIRGQDRLDDRLGQLPFSVRDALEQLRGTDDRSMSRLLEFFESATVNPGEKLSQLLDPPVTWVGDLPAGGLVALAEFSAAHGLANRASSLYEQASNTGLDRSRYLALAALFAAQSGDRDRSTECITRAVEISDGDDIFVTTVQGALEENIQDMLRGLDAARTGTDSIVVAIVAQALAASDRLDEAIELLRRSTSQSPDRAGHQILLAQLLLRRIGGPGSPTRTADLAEAQRCALLARDSRRSWQGNSGEAVAVACQVAFLEHDYRGALRVGLAAPEGEARHQEAGDLAVLSFVSRAFLAAGDFARAKDTAERSENQCLEELIAAKASLFSDPPDTEGGIEHVEAAWSFAETDADRLDIQVTAAGLGMWPLPGHADLEIRDDDMAAVLLAQSEHVLGRDDDAIARLRQYEGSSEQCAMVLAQIYADQGRTDDAVEELRHAANRFQRPAFLLPGAQFLMRAGRHQEAKELAAAVLAEMDAGAPARRDARLFLIEMARMQSNWHEVEGQARALVTEKFWLDGLPLAFGHGSFQSAKTRGGVAGVYGRWRARTDECQSGCALGAAALFIRCRRRDDPNRR